MDPKTFSLVIKFLSDFWGVEATETRVKNLFPGEVKTIAAAMKWAIDHKDEFEEGTQIN